MNALRLRTIYLSPLFILLIIGCDPSALMKASIENSTSIPLEIQFISSDNAYNQFLQVSSGESVVFQDVFDVGNTYLEPDLDDFDSVVVRNQNNDVLKVYKPQDTDKNIYNLLYWQSSTPAKRSFVYVYSIDESDIQ